VEWIHLAQVSNK